jgi:hypothetical protein
MLDDQFVSVPLLINAEMKYDDNRKVNRLNRGNHILKALMGTTFCYIVVRLLMLLLIFSCTFILPITLSYFHVLPSSDPNSTTGSTTRLTTEYLLYGPFLVLLLSVIVMPIWFCCIIVKESYKTVTKKMKQYDLESLSKTV